MTCGEAPFYYDDTISADIRNRVFVKWYVACTYCSTDNGWTVAGSWERCGYGKRGGGVVEYLKQGGKL